MENRAPDSKCVQAQILVFPSRVADMGVGPIFYLFSVRQVVEVLPHPDIQPVPFGPTHAEGVAQWRGRILPVMSLEDSLGIEKSRVPGPLRTLVVRSVTAVNPCEYRESYAIFKVGAAARQLTLPIDHTVLPVPRWIGNPSCLKGIYQMRHEIILAPNIEEMIGVEPSGS